MAYKKQTEKTKYHSNDPVKRANQLGNIGKGRQDKKIKGKTEQTLIEEVRSTDIITFIEDKRFLGQSLYPAQRVILKSLYGLTLTPDELDIYKQLTGLDHEHEPGKAKTEALLCLGARSGKSFLAACIALYESTRPKYKKYIRPGEAAYCVIVATKQDQARMIIQRNAGAMMWNSPLRKMLACEPNSLEIEFKDGMRIISLPCNSTAGRGLPITTLIFDEIGFFYGDGYVRSDYDIFNSLRPRQAQFPNAKTLLISTPAAKQGAFWDWFQEGFNVPGRLTCQAPTWIINPQIPVKFFEKEKERDLDNYQREYAAQFAERTSSYFQYEYIDKALTLAQDVKPQENIGYFAAVDFSGLTGRDQTGFAIAHRDGNNIIVDIARSWDSQDQDFIIAEIEGFCKDYNINTIYLDRYAAGWTQAAMKNIGLQPELREGLPVIYSNLKSLMISGRVSMPDMPDLKKSLQTVRAFYGRNNSLSIQHERNANGHNDMLDALTTAVYYASKKNTDTVIAVFGLGEER